MQKSEFNLISYMLTRYHNIDQQLKEEHHKIVYSQRPLQITINYDRFVHSLEHYLIAIYNTLDESDDKTVELITDAYFDQKRSLKSFDNKEKNMRNDFFDKFGLNFGLIDVPLKKGVNANESKR
ncbi:MAG: hypothetical protein ABF630_09835 [Liquorilactobacillus sp.]|uniref:hypothetical protein n=1 Tax=Liquorilactobacillus nagelii TaxID=82688 RepID=UPI0039EBF6CA